MNDICRDKYKNYKIYFHNFSRFDGNFLVKYLSSIGKCTPIIHNGKIISLRFTNQNYTVTFKDSYLLLPASLRKLGKAFNVETHKSIFPYLLPDISYKGPVPDFKYFTDISLETYNEYKESFKGKEWNFRAESTLYCVKDCISLHQVLSKFQLLIKDKFQLNINKYLTLPSLAFKIFRTHYFNTTNMDNTIHMLSGDISKDIRTSYTGGSVDMFIPVPKKGEKVYCYDVNSLYPYVMKTFDMPVGKPTYFKGDITKLDPNAFGFFKCKIIAPLNLKHPIIQTHVKTNEGIRTISPLGTW